jgi:hypothetical protein
MRPHLAILLPIFALSCASKSLDLQATPHVTPSKDPTVLGSIDEQVTNIAVDDERLYWMGSQGQFTGFGGFSLRGCEKKNCASTLVTYDSGEAEPAGSFGVENGQIYWFHFHSEEPSPRWDLRGCDVSGCASAARMVVADIAWQNSPVAYSSDAVYLGLTRIPLSGNAPALAIATVAASTDWIMTIGIQDDYLYWVEPSPGLTGTLRRAFTSGDSAPEDLAHDVEIAPPPYFRSELAFDSSYVYWTQGTLKGAIERCPLAGCTGAPEVVAAPIRSPLTARIDGSKIYWLHDSSTQGFEVSSCTLGNCTQASLLASGVDGANALAIDDQYLYTASTDHGLNPDLPWNNPMAQIRRFPK